MVRALLIWQVITVGLISLILSGGTNTVINFTSSYYLNVHCKEPVTIKDIWKLVSWMRIEPNHKILKERL